MKKRRGQIDGRLLAVLIAVGVILAFVVPLRGRWWLPPLSSEHGAATDKLFIITLIITSVVFALVQLVLAYLIWRYPHKEGQRSFYFVESHKMEMVWTIVPAVVMLALIASGYRTWAKVHSEPPEDAFKVEVVGEQFKWAFRYPGKDGEFGRINPKLISDDNPLGVDPQDPHSQDDIVIPPGQGELHLPVKTPVEVYLRSKDVLHSFFLPHMRIKQDAVPGMTVKIWFVPTKTTAARKADVGKRTEREYSLSELRRLMRAGVPFVAAGTYKSKAGEDIVTPDMPLFAETLPDLQKAGHDRIKAHQDFNYELLCAELCGLGHYKMSGVAVIDSEKELEEWMSQQTPFGG